MNCTAAHRLRSLATISSGLPPDQKHDKHDTPLCVCLGQRQRRRSREQPGRAILSIKGSGGILLVVILKHLYVNVASGNRLVLKSGVEAGSRADCSRDAILRAAEEVHEGVVVSVADGLPRENVLVRELQLRLLCFTRLFVGASPANTWIRNERIACGLSAISRPTHQRLRRSVESKRYDEAERECVNAILVCAFLI